MKQYRLYIYLLIAGLSVCCFHAPAANAQIGFSAGYNYSKLTDIDLGSGLSSFENAEGWHMELWFDVPVRNISLRPGLRFISAGRIFQFANDANANFRDDFNISLFEIPIDFRFRFNMQVTMPFISVGPVLRFPSGSKSEIDGMRSVSMAGGLGIGLELNFGSMKLYPELKYTFGLTRFTAEEFQIAGIPFSTTDTQLLNGVMLRLGVGL